MDIFLDFAKYIGTFLFIAVAVRLVIETLSKDSSVTPKKANYKNIAIMANNLVNSRVSTRKEVLMELREDPEWTEEEFQELKSVVEGMLKTKIFLDEDDDNPGLKSI